MQEPLHDLEFISLPEPIIEIVQRSHADALVDVFDVSC